MNKRIIAFILGYLTYLAIRADLEYGDRETCCDLSALFDEICLFMSPTLATHA